ncbi:MAG: hypothetical protein R3B89_34830 [Polyangiaceae bacterium]
MYTEAEIQEFYARLRNRAENLRFVVSQIARLDQAEQDLAGGFSPRLNDWDGWRGQISFYRERVGASVTHGELAVFAHEVGHGQSMLMGLRTIEYERALDRFNVGGTPDASRLLEGDKAPIAIEEARGWILGMPLLCQLGYRDLEKYWVEARQGLEFYKHKLEHTFDSQALLDAQDAVTALRRIDQSGIIGRLALLAPGEESMTQVLAEILKVPRLRAAMLGLVGVNHSGPCYVEAESIHDTTKGVPDIVVRGEHLLVMFENKLNSGFSSNQPHEYYSALERWRRSVPDGVAALAVLVPERRIASVETQIGTRVRASPEVATSVNSWQRALEVLQKVAREPGELALVRLLRKQVEEQMGVTTARVSEEATKLVRSPEFGASVFAYQRLLAELRERLNAAPKRELKAENDKADFTYSGFTFYASPTDSVWVGLSFQVLADTGRGPLIAQVSSRARLLFSDIVLEADEAQSRYGWDFEPVVELDATLGAERLVQQLLGWLKPADSP